MQDLPLILSDKILLLDPFIFRRDYYTDGAYDTKHCRKVILDRQAHAVIPPKNSKHWKDKQSRSIERNELLKTVKPSGRSLWKKWFGYHRRSLVETKMHCIKLLGDKLTARSFPS